MTDLAAGPRDWTAGQITEGIALAVKERDFEAVVALLRMLALKDPHKAEVLYQSMLAVLGTTKGGTDG